MLVSTPAGSAPHASASRRAWSWSSASRSTWWSRAYAAAAASTPTCRIPPPSRLRQTRASVTAASEPTIIEPTGAPRPLEKHTHRTSAIAPYAVSGVPLATWAFQMRAPSRCTATSDAVAHERSASRSPIGSTAPPAKLWVFSTETAVVRTKKGPMSGANRPEIAARSTWPRGEVQVRMVTPPKAPCAPSSARAMWADDSHSTSWPGATRDRTASRLASDPVGVNNAASCPNSAATRSWRALTVGSSPYTSSPTSAAAIAARISSVGRVTVSLRRSMRSGTRPIRPRGRLASCP